jgi:hypothetical protein
MEIGLLLGGGAGFFGFSGFLTNIKFNREF